MKVVPTTAAGSHATGPNDDGNNNGKSVQDIVLDTMSTKHIRVAVVGTYIEIDAVCIHQRR